MEMLLGYEYSWQAISWNSFKSEKCILFGVSHFDIDFII